MKILNNIPVLLIGVERPWQNGVCERNHTIVVVDCCITKILEDKPENPLPVAV